MEIYELPLVFFTVVTQWGIGGVLALTLCLTGHAALFNDRQRVRLALLFWGITVIGSLASLAHLGTPFGAYRALYGLAHSWLSREVVAFIILNALLSLWLLAAWKAPRLFLPLGWAGALAGVAAILVSAQVYAQMRLHPLWNTLATPAAFLGCALLLGCMSVAMLANALGQSAPGRLRAAWGAGLALVAGALVWRFQEPGADGASPLFWWQLFASLLPGGVALLAARQISAGYALLAVMLVVTGELAGRMLFYANVMSGAPWF